MEPNLDQNQGDYIMSITKPKKTLASLKSAFGGTTNDEKPQNNYVNNYYPFWDMPMGSKVVMRFLPDLNEENPRGFLVEKVTHKLTINGQEKKIPCLSMYGLPCPICALSQSYYKAKDEINGKKYWKNRQNLGQAIIVEDPLPVDDNGESHAGKVRMIALGYQIFAIIKAAFADEDLEGVPYDFVEGHDFVIKKTEQGSYASYTIGTKFLSKSRPLTAAELAAAEEGMVDLSTLLPKNPGVEAVQAQLDAEQNGTSYEAEAPAAPARAAKPAAKRPVVADDEDDDKVPFDTAPTVAPKAKAPVADASEADPKTNVDDMLATIKARRQAAKAAAAQ
jgi:hypothetical protein